MRQRHTSMGLFGRLFALLAMAAILSACVMAEEKSAAKAADPAASGGLTGWMLVATPRMRDPRFARTVILLVRHDDRGALGLIVNRPISVKTASGLLRHMMGKAELDDDGREVRIQYGGPVEPRRWYFIHSNDYASKGTTEVTDHISLTSSVDILRAMADGKGPAKGFLAIGYAGWGPGQLEKEIRRRDWVTIQPDDRILFDGDMGTKWRRAMDKRGIDL